MRVKTKSGVVPPSDGTTSGSRPKPLATAAFTRGTIAWSSGVRDAGVPLRLRISMPSIAAVAWRNRTIAS